MARRGGTEIDMRSVQLLADGHHVDEAGNLIACTYVDLRDPVDRSPITTLTKASSKRHAVPGCETMRLSKPSRFLDRGEGLIERGEDGSASGTSRETARTEDRPDRSGRARAIARADTAPPERLPATTGEVHYGRNGWIYCACIEPGTPAERTAWRAAMPSGYDAVSPIRRPREFARALGAMAAEQVGPRGRLVLLRNTVDGQMFCTAHRSQTVYHGPVVYPDDPYRRLERASSDLELLLLLVFMKHPAHRAQREYRFAVWTDEEPAEDGVDLKVSPTLLEAMRKGRPEPEGSGFVSAGVEESSALEDIGGPGASGMRLYVEALPAFAGLSNPTLAPQPYVVGPLPGDASETTLVYATVKALRAAVDGVAAVRRQEAAAAAWHAEPILRFFCSAFGDGIVGVRVSEDGFIVVTAEFSENELVEATIAVGPDGTCACKISAGETHIAATAPDARSFEQVLKSRLAEVGVYGEDGRRRG